jgi:hypothetical protein
VPRSQRLRRRRSLAGTQSPTPSRAAPSTRTVETPSCAASVSPPSTAPHPRGWSREYVRCSGPRLRLAVPGRRSRHPATPTESESGIREPGLIALPCAFRHSLSAYGASGFAASMFRPSRAQCRVRIPSPPFRFCSLLQRRRAGALRPVPQAASQTDWLESAVASPGRYVTARLE